MTETIVLPLAELRDFDADRLIPDEHNRIDVVTDYFTMPLLVVPRTGADKLVVLNNGAVDQHRAAGEPVFQRSTWSDEIRHHQIYVYDPATGGPEYLSLGWGQVSPEKWAAFYIGRVVRTLAVKLGVSDPRDRMYFGSSAGGFMALALLADDEGARAVINNAQFDWTRWMATGVNALRHARFGGMLPADIRARFPLTANVLNLLARRGRPLRIDYHVNVASTHDRKEDLPTFNAFLAQHPQLCGDVKVHHYFDRSAGHNPLAKPDTLGLLNGAFDRI
ncbi:hypothetical protein GCM10011374_29620 [Kocuria dechangensis]|uniref:Alpha/beta hydrolase n=1 Tax=Kocuria dechangensis TaxID=1176249 RepID=A0A917LXG7_9MICC|nr:hypothetical protein [Kocuria dechangensis]GGG64144.1 hypothetical protein GCM10011374_29620 [Kocuria dechangensis]